MNRRGFLSGILLACAAPAIVRADSLMRIVPMDTTILAARPILDVQKIIADMEASDALAAGLQIREWSQYVLDRNETLTRYDVMAESENGAWHQLGVDFRGGVQAENREMVRTLLAGRIRAEGLKPKVWTPELPEGARLI